MTHMYRDLWLSAVRWFWFSDAHSRIFGAAPCAGSSSAQRPPPAPHRIGRLLGVCWMVPRHPPPTHHPPTTHPHTHQPPSHTLDQRHHTRCPSIHPSTTHSPTRYHPHTSHLPPTHVWFGMLYVYGYARLSAVRCFCFRAAHSGKFGAAPCAGSSSAHRPPPAPLLIAAPRAGIFRAAPWACSSAAQRPPPAHHLPTTHPPAHQPPSQTPAQPQHTHSTPIHPSTTHPPTRCHTHTTHHPPTHV